MRLIGGDEEKLEGKVIIFSKLKKGNKTDFLALYGAARLEDMVSKTGADMVMDKNIAYESGVDYSMFRVYAADLYGKNRNNWPVIPEDIIYAGEYTEFSECKNHVRESLKEYFRKFEDQVIESRIKEIADKEEYCKEDEDGKDKELQIEDIETHEYFKGASINDYLTRNYVIPMMIARSHGQKGKIREIKERFMLFSDGSYFETHAQELCGIIEKEGKNAGVELIKAHTLRISAIHREDYELAIRMRDRIDDMGKTG